jgi:Domain of unknown function (DUF4189)
MYKKLPFLTAIIFGLLILIPVDQAQARHCGYQRCWGAVGFGPGGAYGFSHSYGSQHQARRQAARACRGDCTVIKTFYNTCGAIAAGQDGGWGWGYAPSRRRASRLALQYCRQNSYNCNVRAWACSK